MQILAILFLLNFNFLFSGNKSFDFSQGTYGRIPLDESLSNFEEFTIEFWYYQQSSGEEFIVATEYFNTGWGFHNENPNVLQLRIENGPYGLGNSNYSIPFNNWIHIAGVYNGSMLSLYVNGNLIASESFTGNVYDSRNEDIVINRHVWASGSSSRLSGQIDELRISNIARYTENFVPQNYEFVSDENTLGLWHFNNDFNDYSGNGNHGIHNGTGFSENTPSFVEVMYGCIDELANNYNLNANFDDGSCTYNDNGDYSLYFNNNSYITTESSLNELIDPDNGFTFELNLKVNQLPQGNPDYWADSDFIFSTSCRYITMRLRSDGKIALYRHPDNSTSECVGSTNINDGNFHHIAYTSENGNGNLSNRYSLYIDGNLECQDYESDMVPDSYIEKVIIGADNNGCYGQFSLEDKYLDGYIKNFRISNTVLYENNFEPVNDFEISNNTTTLYKFNEGYGLNTIDYSFNQNHGTILGASWIENIYGCNDELAINYNSNVNWDNNSCEYPDNGDYSLNFEKDTDQKVLTPKWFDNNDSFTFIVDVMLEENQNNQSGILCHNALENDVTLQVSDNGIGAAIYRPGQSNLGLHYETINDGLFHRVISKYDGNSFYLQIDDEIVDSVLNENYNINWDQGYHSNSIGWRWTTQGQTAINGRIKEVYIFSSDLLQIEIDSLSYDIIPENLEAHYKFNEGNGNILYDHSGNQNHGTIQGATWIENIYGCTDDLATNYNFEANLNDFSCEYSDNGEFSLGFEYSNSYVNIGNPNDLDFMLNDSFNLELDFLTTDSLGDSYILYSYGDADGCAQNEKLIMFYKPQYNRLHFFMRGNSEPQTNSEVLSHNIFSDQWYNIKVERDFGNELRLFIDDVLVDISDDVTGSISLLSETNHYIGAYEAISTDESCHQFNSLYNGNIDNFKIFKISEDIADTNQIILDYRFNAGEGDIVYDHSGNGNHGLIQDAIWVEKIYGCKDQLACNYDEEANENDNSCDYSCHNNGDFSLSFDGINDYISLENFQLFNHFSIIFKLSMPDLQNEQELISQWENNETKSWRLYIKDYTLIWEGYDQNHDLQIFNIDAYIDYNSFDDIFLGISKVDEDWSLIINSEVVMTNIEPGFLFESQDKITIGKRNLGSSNYFLGNIDEFLVSNSSFDHNGFYDNLIIHYKFNEGNGDIVFDHSGNENHGEIFGATWTDNIILGCLDTLACNYNEEANEDDESCDYSCLNTVDYSLSFDGIDDYVESLSVLDFLTNSSITMMTWIKKGENSYGNYGIIGSKVEGSSSFYFVDRTTDIECRYIGENGEITIHIPLNFENENEWNHIALVYDGFSLSSYLNAEIVDYESIEDNNISTGYITSFETNFKIGKLNSVGFWQGDIDEIKIFNKAISQEEIYLNMISEYNNSGSNLIAYFTANTGYGFNLVDHSGNQNHGTIYGASWMDNSVNQCCFESYGDVNCDTILDISDIIIIIDMILDLINFTYDQNDCADINTDDIVDISDLILLIDSILGF